MATSPYATVEPLFQAADKPGWVAEAEQARIQSYDVYDNIYNNSPQTFLAVWRGTPLNPIYIPGAKMVIEACNRYLAVDFDLDIRGSGGAEQPSQETADSPATGNAAAIEKALGDLFRRENFFSKFNTQKRNGLVRGEFLWHLIADPEKPEGTRISIQELHPKNYFPMLDPNDPTRIVGAIIASQVVDPTDPSKFLVKRLKYTRDTAGKEPVVTSELGYYELDKWDDRIDPNTGQTYHESVAAVAVTDYEAWPTRVIAGITSLPVYSVKNQRDGSLYGRSQLAGLERIFAGLSQAMSDEEIALALEGLGVYWTDGGAPTDAEGNTVNWKIAPGRVVEVGKDAKFGRVKGMDSVKPYHDHQGLLMDYAQQASGTPDIAMGNVDDVSVAESGIALALKMNPMLAQNAEKELEIIGIHDNLYYDLVNEWLPVYEGLTLAGDVIPKVGDPMPLDRAAFLAEVQNMMEMGIMTVEEAQIAVRDRLGYSFDLSSLDALARQEQKMSVARDSFTARMLDESRSAEAQ